MMVHVLQCRLTDVDDNSHMTQAASPTQSAGDADAGPSGNNRRRAEDGGGIVTILQEFEINSAVIA